MPTTVRTLDEMTDAVARLHARWRDASSAPLVGVSGIDVSGKGWVAGRLTARLQRRGLYVALVGLNPWHHPRSVRMSDVNPGVHFYEHAFRWDDLFDLLLAPLRARRSVDLTVPLLDLATDRYYNHLYRFAGVDVVVLEGSFLLKRSLRGLFDQTWWVECSFETAMRRAVRRNEEGLSEQEVVAAYERVYFPAQRHHFAADDPAAHADGILPNDRPAAPGAPDLVVGGRFA